MLSDGVYGLTYVPTQSDGLPAGEAVAVLRQGRIVGSDPHGGLFSGTCEAEAESGGQRLRVRLDVPPEGELVTGQVAGPNGSSVDIEARIAGPSATAVVDVDGVPLEIRLRYLGPLP